jgi:hypothetical protein
MAIPFDYRRNRFDYSCKQGIVPAFDEPESVGFFYDAGRLANALKQISSRNQPKNPIGTRVAI